MRNKTPNTCKQGVPKIDRNQALIQNLRDAGLSVTKLTETHFRIGKNEYIVNSIFPDKITKQIFLKLAKNKELSQ